MLDEPSDSDASLVETEEDLNELIDSWCFTEKFAAQMKDWGVHVMTAAKLYAYFKNKRPAGEATSA